MQAYMKLAFSLSLGPCDVAMVYAEVGAMSFTQQCEVIEIVYHETQLSPTPTTIHLPYHLVQWTKTSIRAVGTVARAALAGMGNVRHGWVSHGCCG